MKSTIKLAPVRFTISAYGKLLRVVFLSSHEEVHKAWIRKYGSAIGGKARAFFSPQDQERREKAYGTVFLPRGVPMEEAIELALHECVHAAVEHARFIGLEHLDDSAEETIARISSILSTRIVMEAIRRGLWKS